MTKSGLYLAFGVVGGVAFLATRKRKPVLNAEKSITIYLPKAQVEQASRTWTGFPQSARLRDALGGRGTEITVRHVYSGPGVGLWHKMLRWMSLASEERELQQLRLFKQLLEAGEVSTIEGQPQGRKRVGGMR